MNTTIHAEMEAFQRQFTSMWRIITQVIRDNCLCRWGILVVNFPQEVRQSASFQAALVEYVLDVLQEVHATHLLNYEYFGVSANGQIIVVYPGIPHETIRSIAQAVANTIDMEHMRRGGMPTALLMTQCSYVFKNIIMPPGADPLATLKSWIAHADQVVPKWRRRDDSTPRLRLVVNN